jgi:hypothetical protein
MVIQAGLGTMTMRKQKLTLFDKRSHDLVCRIEGLEEIPKGIPKILPRVFPYVS